MNSKKAARTRLGKRLVARDGFRSIGETRRPIAASAPVRFCTAGVARRAETLPSIAPSEISHRAGKGSGFCRRRNFSFGSLRRDLHTRSLSLSVYLLASFSLHPISLSLFRRRSLPLPLPFCSPASHANAVSLHLRIACIATSWLGQREKCTDARLTKLCEKSRLAAGLRGGLSFFGLE